jgi:hypothetical protein
VLLVVVVVVVVVGKLEGRARLQLLPPTSSIRPPLGISPRSEWLPGSGDNSGAAARPPDDDISDLGEQACSTAQASSAGGERRLPLRRIR